MQTMGLYLVTIVSIATGIAATILSAQLVPLRIRELGQQHGRFCWLHEPVAEVKRR